jgi:arylsulfatase A-like enzyme
MVLIAMFGLTIAAGRAAESERRPNIVVILSDNQGAWTLGCYGNPDIRTPRLDRLAREGTLFRHCYSSNAVCSPTRATLLTGLIPSQHGVHSYLSAGGVQMGPGAHSTIEEFRNLPEILAEAGYVCGLSGKWHLGGNATPQEGFTDWVTMPHGHTTTFYDAEVVEAGQVRKEPAYLTDFWTDHGVRFIERHKDEPFFLYLAYNGPYGLGESLQHPARNRHAAYYADKQLESFPREPAHPWLRANKQALNNVAAMRRYAAEVSGVDDGVGRILDALKEQGLEENTIVVFTADQGLACGQNGFWGMGDHTRPLTAYDWTMHVPLIYRHPGRITASSESDMLVSNYDFLPTMLEHLDLQDKLPQTPPLPGRSYAVSLQGRPMEWDGVMYFEYENTRAVRTSTWKFITRFPDGVEELYHLSSDRSERTNLAGQADYADTKKALRTRLEKFFEKYADPRFDLAQGGVSKAPRRWKGPSAPSSN